MSTSCFWMLLVDTHAIAVQCGSPLVGNAEQRYRQLRQAAEAEIVRDASLSPGESPDKAKSGMAQYIANGEATRAHLPNYCNTVDTGAALSMLKTVTTAANASKIIAGLRMRKNPYDGDCL
jgi:hypothetical protein